MSSPATANAPVAGTPCTPWLWALTALFGLRTGGQAVQYWIPQRTLPPFEAFQGSSLPYWILLPSQLAILGVMAWFAFRVQKGTARHRRTGDILALAGSIYLVLSLGRIAIGLVDGDAPAWFRAWIPAAFHGVLAAYVLTLAAYHRQARPRHRGGPG